MRRLKKLIKILLWAITIVVVIAIALYFLAMPAIARSQINRILAEMGARPSVYELQHVSLFGLTLQRVELGQPSWLSADQITSNYTPWSLWSGRVRDLTLINAIWRITVHEDGRIDFGPQPTGSLASAQTFDLPIDSLSLRNGTVILKQGDQTQTVQITGSILRQDTGIFTSDLSIQSKVAIAWPHAKLLAQGVTARMHARLEFSTDELRVFALSGTEIFAKQVADADASPTWRFAPLRLGVDENATNAAVRMALQSAASPIVQATIRVEQAAFTSAPAQFALAGVSGSVPIGINVAPPQLGEPFQIQTIKWRDIELPALTGSVAVHDDDITGDFKWPLMPSAVLSAHASATLTNAGLAGELNAKIPSFELTDSSLLKQLVPQLKSVSLGGTYALDATMAIQHSELKPLVKLTAKHASIATDDQSLSITDAEASVTINSFSPLTTPVSQWVRVHQGQVGKLPINDGIVYFVLENTNSLAVQQADISMGDYGKFKAQPFRFNPLNPVFKTNLACSDVGLNVWLPLLSNNRASGTGQLTGDLQIVVQPNAKNVFDVGQGNLQAQNPPGTIQASDVKAVSQYLEDAKIGSSDETLSETRERVVRALTDFRYNVLQITLVPEQGSTTAKVQIQGIGRTGADPVPIGGLTLNIENFDVLLRTILNVKSRL